MRPVQFGSIQPIPRELTQGLPKAKQKALARQEGKKLHNQPGVSDVQVIAIPIGIVDLMNRLFEEAGRSIDMNKIWEEAIAGFTRLTKKAQSPMQYFLLADDELGTDKSDLADNVETGNPFSLYLTIKSWEVLERMRDRSNYTPEHFETFH